MNNYKTSLIVGGYHNGHWIAEDGSRPEIVLPCPKTHAEQVAFWQDGADSGIRLETYLRTILSTSDEEFVFFRHVDTTESDIMRELLSKFPKTVTIHV